jgi:hypothetical protein
MLFFFAIFAFFCGKSASGAAGRVVTSVVHSVSMKHGELTGQIIGAAMAVLKELKPDITGLEVALLLNFKESKLAWKRVVRGQPK